MESKCYLGQSNKRRLDSDEAKALIEKVDVAWMLEHFGSDKMAARAYARQEAGDKMLIGRDFVEKAYCTMGIGFDPSLPKICSENFWNRIKDVTLNPDLRNSSFLRYIELAVPDNDDIKLIVDGKLRRPMDSQWYDHSQGNEMPKLDDVVGLNELTETRYVSLEVVLVVTGRNCYFVRQAADADDTTWHFYHEEKNKDIKCTEFYRLPLGQMVFVPHTSYYMDEAFIPIKVVLNSHWELEDRLISVMEEILPARARISFERRKTWQ